jgi:Arc/MetJ family transcription regulator
MRTTLIIDDELLLKAQKATGIKEKTSVIHRALETLVSLEASRRLARLGGTMPDLKAPPRRRVEDYQGKKR